MAGSEDDARDDGHPSTLPISELQRKGPTYPTTYSTNRDDGTPIPWGALSGLAGDPHSSKLAYAVYDSYYKESRILVLDPSRKPAKITDELVLLDGGATLDLDLEGIAAREDGGFWIVSDGAGVSGDPDGSLKLLNLGAIFFRSHRGRFRHRRSIH